MLCVRAYASWYLGSIVYAKMGEGSYKGNTIIRKVRKKNDETQNKIKNCPQTIDAHLT